MTPKVTKAYRKVYHFKLDEEQVKHIASAMAALFNITADYKIAIPPLQAQALMEILQYMKRVTEETSPIVMLKENLL